MQTQTQKIRIVIGEDDRRYIDQLARDLYRAKQKSAHLNTHPNKQQIDQRRQTLDLDTVGLAAEFAVSQLLGVPMNTDYQPGSGDNGVDFIKDGLRYQVKYNHYNWGDLYSRLNYPRNWDVAVLATGSPDAIHLLGWMDLAGFERLKVQKSYGYNQVWAVAQDLLYPISTLPGRVEP